MIASTDIVLDVTPVPLWEGANITVSAIPNEIGSPCDLRIEIDENRVVEPTFVGMRYSISKDKLAPVLEVFKLNGTGNYGKCILAGTDRIAFINPKSAQPVMVHPLFRSPSDDTGFYREEVTTNGASILYIYEGGILCITHDGTAVWHFQLYWDDLVIHIAPDEIEISNEFSGTFILDAKTGKKRRRQIDCD